MEMLHWESAVGVHLTPHRQPHGPRGQLQSEIKPGITLMAGTASQCILMNITVKSRYHIREKNPSYHSVRCRQQLRTVLIISPSLPHCTLSTVPRSVLA